MDTLRPSLRRETRVIVYENFEQFAAAPKDAWDGTRWKPATANPTDVAATDDAETVAAIESAPSETGPV